MNKTLRAFLLTMVCMVLLSTGCANSWQHTYASAATMKEFVTNTHKTGWSDPLNDQREECNESLDPEVNTKADFDECMGPYSVETNKKILTALEVYKSKAAILSAVLLATDPENPDPEKLQEAFELALGAAQDLLALLPEGKRNLSTLKKLTK